MMLFIFALRTTVRERPLNDFGGGGGPGFFLRPEYLFLMSLGTRFFFPVKHKPRFFGGQLLLKLTLIFLVY